MTLVGLAGKMKWEGEGRVWNEAEEDEGEGACRLMAGVDAGDGADGGGGARGGGGQRVLPSVR